jgi:hypothetical protein
MPLSRLVVFVTAAVLIDATPALATNVFLNGVQVDGLTNQKFEKATVTFDANGNVRIDAPGYQVQTLGAGGNKPAEAMTASATPATPASMSKHYFLVTEQSNPGMTGYDIDVFVNSKWIRKLKGTEDQIVVDVTKYLAPGPNKILFAAKKAQGERKSFSPQHTFNVIVGEGAAGGDQVMIDNPLITFKRSAADTDDVSEEYSLNAR